MIFPLTSLFVISGWAVSLVFSVVLARRYEPAKAWAWLAILLAFPWVGLGLYLLLGENPLGRPPSGSLPCCTNSSRSISTIQLYLTLKICPGAKPSPKTGSN